MAELAVLALILTPVLQELVTIASDHWRNRRSSASRLGDDLNNFNDELEVLILILNYADRSNREDVKTWVKKVRSLAFEFEDILDDHNYCKSGGVADKGAVGAVGRLSGKVKAIGKAEARPKTAERLERIKPKLDSFRRLYDVLKVEIHKMPTTRFPSTPPHGTLDPGSSRNTSAGNREQEQKLVWAWLRERLDGARRDDLSRLSIAVWGCGGVGKTTFVSKVYKEAGVGWHFERRAWVNVSKTNTNEGLLQDLRRQLCEEEHPRMLEEQHPATQTRKPSIEEVVRGKRCLIVFDDVADGNFWGRVGHVFRETGDRSRIVFTTREERVARSLAWETRVLSLASLPLPEAWSLFSSIISGCFRGDEYFWADRIVSKCEGLPLVIASAAYVMSKKERDLQAWQRTSTMLEQEQGTSSSTSINTLMDIYYNMPLHLKLCFLYCSIFPGDGSIKRKLLVRLWVAEGFVEKRDGKTLEEVAEDHLEELCRHLIQVVTRNDSGRVKTCRLHDDSREAALEISGKQRFAAVHDGDKFHFDGKARRLGIHAVSGNMKTDTGKLRSLLLFAKNSTLINSSNFFEQSKLLRVLDLTGLPIREIPRWLFKLYNLRYLSLRDTKIQVEEFPDDIDKLGQLQTLDLRKTRIGKLPRNVLKLGKLRHLFFDDLKTDHWKYKNFCHIRGAEAPKGLSDLKDLQTLRNLVANKENVVCIEKLEQMRTLFITEVKKEHCRQLFESVAKMTDLRRLKVHANVTQNSFICKESLSNLPAGLRKLVLKGKFLEGPGSFPCLTQLTQLCLFESVCGDGCERLGEIGSLPELVFLALERAFVDKKLVFKAGSFPKLKIMCLENMAASTIVVQEGALPVLRRMYVRGCKQLRRLHGMENLKALQELTIGGTTEELKRDLAPICGNMRVILKVTD